MTTHKKPSQNEDEYFAKRDAELLRQHRQAAQRAATEAEALVKHPEPTIFGRVFRAVMRGVSGARASDS